MIASMDAKFSGGIRKNALFDVFHVGPVDSYWHVVFRFAGNGACMATDARPIVDYESIVCHSNPYEGASVENDSVAPFKEAFR